MIPFDVSCFYYRWILILSYLRAFEARRVSLVSLESRNIGFRSRNLILLKIHSQPSSIPEILFLVLVGVSATASPALRSGKDIEFCRVVSKCH